MAFIDTICTSDATGDVLEMYARQQQAWGFVPNYAKVFGHRPEVMSAWANLLRTLKGHVDRRTFELVTFAAAHALGSSSCSLAHGKVLNEQYLTTEEVRALATEDEARTTLTDAERAMVRYARKVVRAAPEVTQDDVAALKAAGLDDGQIFDVAAIAAGRAFFANLIEALGARPDPVMATVPGELLPVLTVGRSIDDAESVRL